MEIIFIFGTALAFFFEFLLLQKRSKSVSDTVLAVWMFFIGLHLFSVYGFIQDLHLRWPVSIPLAAPLPLVHGPFLLLYVLGLIREKRKIRWFDGLHFLPYLFGASIFFPFLGLPRETLRVLLYDPEAYDWPWYFIAFNVAIQVSGLLYALAAHFLLQGHRRRIKDRFSFEEEVSLTWLRYNILAIGLIYLIVIFSIVLDEVFGLLPPLGRDYMIYTSVTLFVFFFGYFGIRQENIFTDAAPAGATEKEEGEAERYRRSGLNPEKTDQAYRRLLDYMDKEKPFLESRLTLYQLAGCLDLSPNHLSQVINEKAGQNFYQFVNSYRIRAFQEKAKDPGNAHLTLLALALECGFNSKSSFNHIFKKFTGMTPSQYQRSLAQ